MLSITILTLLITGNVISRIQAEETRLAQLNKMQTPVNGSDSVLEALKVQKGDTFNIVPESYIEQKDHADKSQSGNRLRRDLSEFPKFSNVNMPEFDAPANRTGSINYFASRVRARNISYNISGGNKDSYTLIKDVIIGNTVSDDSNATNIYLPTLELDNITYQGNYANAQYGVSVTLSGNSFSRDSGKNDINIFTGIVDQKGNTYSGNPKNKTLLAISVNQSNNVHPEWVENNKNALKPVIQQSENSSNDPEDGMNTKNNTEGQVDISEQNATNTQGSSSTNQDSSSPVENKILHTKKRETHADLTLQLHFEPNRQMSLSSNVFYSLSYSLIILLKYSQF